MGKLLKAQPRLRIHMERCRCGKCDARFEHEMVANIEMSIYIAQMKTVRCPNCGQGSKGIMLGEGHRLDEDRADRAEAGVEAMTIARRYAWWREQGDVGNSSRSIAHHMLGLGPHGNEWSAPCDLGDFRRCMLLLDLMPEWTDRVHEMAQLNEEWARIAPIWHEVAAAFVRDCPNYAGVSSEAHALLTGRDD